MKVKNKLKPLTIEFCKRFLVCKMGSAKGHLMFAKKRNGESFTALDYWDKLHLMANQDLVTMLTGGGRKVQVMEQWNEKVLNPAKQYIDDALNNATKKGVYDLWVVGDAEAQNIMRFIPINLKGYKHQLVASEIRHIQNNHGTKSKRKLLDNEIAVTKQDLYDIPDIIANFDKVEIGTMHGELHPTIRFIKIKNDGTYTVVETITKGKELRLKTMWKDKPSSLRAGKSNPPNTSKTADGALSTVEDILQQKGADVNNIFEQAAFHGSGVGSIQEFDLGYLGTGEGAQAHGWGLYFAKDRKVAETYKEALDIGSGTFDIDGEQYKVDGTGIFDSKGNIVRDDYKNAALTALANFKDADKAKERLEQRLKEAKYSLKEAPKSQYYKLEVGTQKKALEWLNSKKSIKATNKAAVYEVEIPDDDVLLDEQKTLDKQPAKVKRALRQIEKEIGVKWHRQLTIGKDIYTNISNVLGSQRAASELLNKYGIKGITYEGNQDGRCFVVFDDKAVEIINVFNQENTAGAITEYWGQEGERFVNEIDKTADIPSAMITVCGTPLLLQNIKGLVIEDLPLQISSALAQSVQKTSETGGKHSHGITREMLAQIPYALQHPAMVLKSATHPGDIVIVTDIKDSKGDTVFVPVVLGTTVHSKGKSGTKKANVIKSIYGKENEKAFLVNQALAGNILYVSKQKSSDLITGYRLQLPQGVIKQSSNVDKIVAEKEAVVNKNILEQMGSSVQAQSAFLGNNVANVERFVNLLKDADITTFFHEAGHIFFVDLMMLGQNPLATEQMKRDWETVLKWTEWDENQLKEYENTAAYGQMAAIDREIREAMGTPQSQAAAPLTGGKRLEAALNRWRQERWARAVEDYCIKGDVPSEGLRKALSNIKKWLVKVYRMLRGAGVPMSKEVKDVMDRMLASKEAVELAAAKAGLEDFRRQGGLDMASDSAKDMWLKLYDEAKERAGAKVRALAMGDLEEERQVQMEEARARERERATKMFQNTRHFRAKAYLDATPNIDRNLVLAKFSLTPEEYERDVANDGGSVENAVAKYMKDVYEPVLQKEFYVTQAQMQKKAEEALQEPKYRAVVTAFEGEILESYNKRFHRLSAKLEKEEAERVRQKREAAAAVMKQNAINIVTALRPVDVETLAETVEDDAGLEQMPKETVFEKVKEWIKNLMGKEITDPLGNKVYFAPGDTEDFDSYALHLVAGNEEKSVDAIKHARVLGLAVAEKTIKKPWAIIVQPNGRKMYLALYKVAGNKFAGEIIVGVEEGQKGRVVTSFVAEGVRRNKNNALRNFKLQVRQSKDVLYLGTVLSGHSRSVNGTEVTQGNAPLHSSVGNSIADLDTDVNILTPQEKRARREELHKETIRQLKEELKSAKQATRQAALEVVRNCRKYAARRMEDLPVSESGDFCKKNFSKSS